MALSDRLRDRLLEQGIILPATEKIVVPKDETSVEIDGVDCPGRVFLGDGLLVTLQPVESNYAETGWDVHPLIWKIKNTYETWLSNGSLAYRVQFYVVE